MSTDIRPFTGRLMQLYHMVKLSQVSVNAEWAQYNIITQV
nr:MAG TPA: hypothetical protein [Caudoviricetes sp.]